MSRRRKEWDVLPASSPVPCTTAEARQWLNVVLPGRKNGKVTGCATPSARKPTEGQLITDRGEILPKSRARDRLRDRGISTTPDAERYAARFRKDGTPTPTGLPYPHRRGSSPCDQEHPVWQGFDEALEEISERLSIQYPNATKGAFRTALNNELRDRNPQWEATTKQCAAQLRALDARKATQSSTRERAQARAALVAAGVDVTASEYRDTLTRSTRQRKRRKK